MVLDRLNSDPSLREVRRIGALATLSLSTGAYAWYAAGSIVEAVSLGDDDRIIATIAASSMTLQNNAIDLLEPGTQLLVGSGAAQETVTCSRPRRRIPSISRPHSPMSITRAITLCRSSA